MSSSTVAHESADLVDSLPYIDRDLEDVAGKSVSRDELATRLHGRTLVERNDLLQQS